MKNKFTSRYVLAVATLLLFSGVYLSCSRSGHTGKGNAVGSVAENTPSNQSQQSTSKSPLPSPTGFVNDFANVFDAESKTRLESVLIDLQNKSGIEFAVVTVETTGGQPIFDYSLAVAKEWGIGPKDTSKGGGLLFMLAIKDRQWRLQVSKRLENDLPDNVSKELGEQSKELYQQGKYAEGAVKYVNAIIERLERIRGFKLSRKL